MEKLFNEHYTKAFNLPGRFTAMNGAIQYFELTSGVALATAPVYNEAGEMTNKAAVAKAQANYLRILEILRSKGAQPVITSVEDVEGKGKVSFTLEQTWVYGKRGPLQVSEHYEDGLADEASKWNGLYAEAKADIEEAFTLVPAHKDGKTDVPAKYICAVDENGEDTEDALFESVDVKTTAGSLNANHA